MFIADELKLKNLVELQRRARGGGSTHASRASGSHA